MAPLLITGEGVRSLTFFIFFHNTPEAPSLSLPFAPARFVLQHLSFKSDHYFIPPPFDSQIFSGFATAISPEKNITKKQQMEQDHHVKLLKKGDAPPKKGGAGDAASQNLTNPHLTGGEQTEETIILLMAEIPHQLIGSLPHYLQGFIHPRWCRISAINSFTTLKQLEK